MARSSREAKVTPGRRSARRPGVPSDTVVCQERQPFKDGKPEGYYENFVTGFWISGERRAEVWGRPAALAVTHDGALLVADDTGGTIWRIAYTARWGAKGRLLRHGNPRGLPAEYFDHVYRTFDRGTQRAVLRLYRNSRNTEEASRQLAEALRPLNLPALVVWGAHDPYISVEFAERQRQVFPELR